VGNTIQNSADSATLGGGTYNTIQNNAAHATLGGGEANTIQSFANSATLGGGTYNTIQTNALYATLGGGAYNTIQTVAYYATIGGGYQNTIQTDARYATLGGGQQNTIQTNALYATLGGGYQNTIDYYGFKATIGGGSGNFIQGYGLNSTIAGGHANRIGFGAEGSTIGGGHENWIADWAGDATIGGGMGNAVGGYGGTVSGGLSNYAGGLSAFAAGRRAQALHDGTFVWADSTDADFASTADNQFLIRAGGGVGIGKNNPTTALDVNGVITASSGPTEGFEVRGAAAGYALHDRATGAAGRWVMFATGGTLGFYGAGNTRMSVTSAGAVTALSFNPTSDRNAKENFQAVNPREVLDKVAALPISEWNFKATPGEAHVGPMAQDFYAAFGTGLDDKHIATVDADGVALAAIQGLNQKLTDELRQKQMEITELKQRMEKLERLMNQDYGGAK